MFQYQVSVPPLLSQSITSFAADLVKDRGGVWSEFSSDYIVSILVPTHVTSPRRVKHLLNAFALAYRLAEDRHQQGLLAESPKDSAAALARLVCLKVEFPLFARDLTVESRLPQMVLDLVGDPHYQWPFAVSDEARDIAERYMGGAAPAQILMDEESEESITNAADPDSPDNTAQTIKASNRQLITYLRRTKSVHGPSRDLVFMQSSGTDFGIDGQTALEIENAAQNGEIDTVAARLKNTDDEIRLGILRLLVHQMRTAVGVEAGNSARTFLGAIGSDDTLPLEPVADSAAEAIALLADDSTDFLDDEVTPHAWTVAAAGSADSSEELRRVVLARLADHDDLDVEFVLKAPRPAIEVDRVLLGDIVSREVVSDNAAEIAGLLGDLEPIDLIDTLAAASGAIGQRLALAIKQSGDGEAASNELGSQDAPGDPEADAHGSSDPANSIEALQGLARASGNGEVSDLVILTLLTVDARPARDGAEELLRDETVAPVTDTDAINSVLGPKGVQRRSAALMLRWIDGVDAGAVGVANAAVIDSLSRQIWTSLLTEDNMSDAEVAALISALATLIERLPEARRPSLTDIATQFFGGEWAQDDATAEVHGRALRCVELCAQTGLLSSQSVYREAVARLADSFAANTATPFQPGTPLANFLLGAAVEAVRGAKLDDDSGAPSSSRLSRRSNRLHAVRPNHSSRSDPEIRGGLGSNRRGSAVDFDATEIVDLVEQLNRWRCPPHPYGFRLTRPSTADSKLVLDHLRQRGLLTEECVDAIESAREHWVAKDVAAFLRTTSLTARWYGHLAPNYGHGVRQPSTE